MVKYGSVVSGYSRLLYGSCQKIGGVDIEQIFIREKGPFCRSCPAFHCHILGLGLWGQQHVTEIYDAPLAHISQIYLQFHADDDNISKEAFPAEQERSYPCLTERCNSFRDLHIPYSRACYNHSWKTELYSVCPCGDGTDLLCPSVQEVSGPVKFPGGRHHYYRAFYHGFHSWNVL